MGVSFSKPKRWSHVLNWPIRAAKWQHWQAFWQAASPSARVIGSASSDALCARALAILRSSVLARPNLFTSDLLVDRCYFVVIQFIVFSAVVVSLWVDSYTSDYVVCAVAAKGDKVFEGVMVCFTRASSCGPTGPPGGDGCRPKYGLFDSCWQRWCYQRRNQPASRITQYNLLDWMGRTEKVPIATLRMEILEAAVRHNHND